MILGTIEEVSSLYGVPASTIRRWVSNGKVARYGARPTRIDLNDVDDLLAAIGKGRNRATRTKT